MRDIWGFDPGVLGLSPREAEQMDPQQRIALQVIWTALEDAGVKPSALAGDDIGVYVGASGLDYANQAFLDQSVVGAHFMTGNTLSILSNRLSYIFDFRGPSFTVDTACSSSLVALNEAMQDLQSGRVETAVVAGVNLLVSPFPFVGFSQATMLSPEGLCRAFDAKGAGYVRAEGCFAFILRRPDAERWSGQKTDAVIVGSGVNSDGRTSGLSLPSAERQAALLQSVYADLGIEADDVAFVEAHGTGTRVGDPAEAGSIGAVLGKERSTPLPIGSVKTNIGHLEPASGLAGLAKAVLSLQHNKLPKSLHFEEPNPDIPFDELNLAVAAEAVELPRTGKRRFAGVNSFGFGGTNAHVVISDPLPIGNAEADSKSSGGEGGRGYLMLTAQSRNALEELASSVGQQFNDNPGISAQLLASAVEQRREHFSERLVVDCSAVDDIPAALDNIANAEGLGLWQGTGGNGAGKVAFVYSGNGSQWAGMGCDAYARNATFRRSFDALDALFSDLSGWSLREALQRDTLADDLFRTEIAQPLLFAVQVALTDALSEEGLKPDLVLGHSVGEVAAACISGALSREQACHVILQRSTSQELIAGTGTMAALMLSETAARKALEDAELSDLEVAAVNSAQSVTISGPRPSIEALVEVADGAGWICKALDLNYPFHSSLIDPAEQSFMDLVGQLDPSRTIVDMVSTVTGACVEGTELDGAYWWRNVRQPVAFLDAVSASLEKGCTSFVEIGPRPVLKSYVRDIAKSGGHPAVALHSLVKPRAGDLEFAGDPVRAIIADALIQDVSLDRAHVFGKAPDKPLPLPFYPWQTQAFRFKLTGEGSTGLFQGLKNPLLGWRLNVEALAWENHVDVLVLPLLSDHVIDDLTIFPGAGYVEMALAAGQEWLGTDDIELIDLDIIQPMILSEEHLLEVRTQISPETGTVEIMSRQRLSGDEYSLHAKGRLLEGRHRLAGGFDAGVDYSEEGTVSGDVLYDGAMAHGLQYGPCFRLVEQVSLSSGGQIQVRLKQPVPVADDQDFILHPAILDSSFHGLFALFGRDADLHDSDAYVPVRFDGIQVFRKDQAIVRCDISIRRKSNQSILADFRLFGADGDLVAEVAGARFKAAAFGRREKSDDLIYREISLRLRSPDQVHQSLFVERDAAALPVEEDEESESRLLVELAARCGARELLLPLVGDDGVVDLSRIPSTLRSYASSLLVHLEDGGFASVEDGVWLLPDTDDIPDFASLIATVLEDHPDEIASVTLLARAVERAHALFAGEHDDQAFSTALVDHFCQGSPDVKARIEHCRDLVRHYLQTPASGEPLRILDLGGAGVELAIALLDDLAIDNCQIVVAETDAQTASRLKGGLDPDLPIEIIDISGSTGILQSKGPFDLVCSVGGLYLHTLEQPDLRFLKPVLASGAPIVAVEPIIDCFHDLVFGMLDNWFSETSVAGYAIGALRSASEWRSVLEDAGATDVVSSETVVSGRKFSTLKGHFERTAADVVPLHSDHDQDGLAYLLVVDDSYGFDVAEALSEHWKSHGAAVTIVDGRDVDVLSRSGTWSDAFAVPDWAQADQRFLIGLNGAFASADDVVSSLARRGAFFSALCSAADGQDMRVIALAPSGLNQNLLENAAVLDPQQAAISGLMRVVQNEAPDLDLRCVDLAIGETAQATADRIISVLGELGSESELLVRSGELRVPRVVQGLPQQSGQTAEAVCLGFDRAGSLARLDWQPVERRTPAAGEVEIEILATGLNFRDVMWALGLLPDEALEDGFSGPTLGLECSGRVVSVSEGVSHLQEGDMVVAFASACFASHTIVPAYAAVSLPEGLDPVAAATIPVTFLTSYYALYHLGRLQEDEWLLIHGGAGGVGLAAIQLAQLKGARIIATAGSPEKRALLRTLGVEHVFDSRSLQFVDDILDLTGGEGVDLVLNSLAGDAMEHSIRLVKPFGRFLELGKRDYYGNTKIALRPFRRNVSYFGIDADQLLVYERALASRLFSEVLDLFAAGDLFPLPYRQFGGEAVIDAFRLMQQSGHIGKIVVTPPRREAWPGQAVREEFAISPDGSVLVVGGLGGFGLEICRWLVDNGAHHVVLTSRSGTISEDHQALIESCEARGVHVEAMACDAADRAALDSVLSDMRAKGPLTGIVHAAMVLDDALLTQLDESRFRAVLEPKVAGADNLDALTRDDALDFFILFSSATTLVGNPGQANYVAANSYLEGLVRKRRQAGLPGLAVGWGAIGDVGYLARNTDVGDILSQKLGEAAIGAREGLDILSSVLVRDGQTDGAGVYYIGRIDWSTAANELAVVKTPRFADFMDGLSLRGPDEGSLDLLELISGHSEADARLLVAELLAVELAQILRLPLEDINVQRPLSEFGMDSLMGLELRMGVQRKIGINLPIVSLSGGTTLNDLALQIVAKALGGAQNSDDDMDVLINQHLVDDVDKAALKTVVRDASGSVSGRA